MTRGSSGYRLVLQVPLRAQAIFEAVLEPVADAVMLGLPDSTDLVELELYMQEEPDQKEVSRLLAQAAAAVGLPTPAFHVEQLPDLDWVAESQKALPPITAGRFFVHGSHVTEAPPAGRQAILIDANVAFGTGRHETTRGCLIALSDLAEDHQFQSILDMGCGSGVLAIAAAYLWPAPVLAADNDPDAVRVSAENAGINGVSDQVEALLSDGYHSGQVEDQGPFDLVLANILAEPLVAMAADLRRHLAPGGTAVLSGLLIEQQEMVLAAHAVEGLALAREIHLEGWATLVLRG